MNSDELKRITCAGIVLYNPELDKLKSNLDSLINQVSEIVLIDNKSKNLELVKNLIEKYNGRISLIENTKNKGIATALNQILRFAQENGYQWYISMDQDSCCSDNMIDEYASCMVENKDVAVLTPYVLNNGKESLKEYKARKLPKTEFITQPIDCITSGALNNVSIIADIGGYDDRLFIDCVDVDINTRIMVLNYKILRVNSAYMIQYMGEKHEVKLIQFLYKITGKNAFKRLRFTPVYSEFRLYYISRNSRYIWRKYGKLAGKRMAPGWMRGQYVYYFLTYPFSYNRLKMIQTISKGLRDSKKMELQHDICCDGNLQ